MVEFGIHDIRIFLPVLGAGVWIGGQLMLAALVPLRGISDAAPRLAARRFALVA